ncbi:alpha/beta fold hydrolase [Dyadobacter psychrotolerans]|uniref:Alpha/beta fold hydrolase n=1 Tax=Dyadobacter psychrotolerans TaxID=2541721 RepID=A0A4R5DA32_9BACT|nr:alpha/beta fold hydrolase [Dyadobacter psychrotolerans]TDE10482.1 alpha/beta fold hydrolase [Dyadobacter psychrotolerans]
MKKLLIIFLLCISVNVFGQNYDEAKVAAYTLPDLLMSVNKKKITTVKDWENIRRPEILSLFEENVYGKMPRQFDNIVFEVKGENKNAMNGKAHLKEVEIAVTSNKKTVRINLILFVPSKIKEPVAAFLLINNRGKENTSPNREVISGFWPAERLIEAGYAIAAFHYSDAAPDNEDTFQNGVLRLYPEQLSAGDGMKAVGAWAWAASRVMDYFKQDKDIDASKVTVVGHSRGGKASLWAAAQDTRFAMCVTNCSGNTGASLSHRRFGETIERINTSFPHWFADNYKKYNSNEKGLPLDQHMLLALVAPRPLYVTNASQDLWADPKGTYLSEKEAEKVYRLYKLTSSLPVSPPAVNMPFVKPPLAYHIREGKHDLTEYDWAQFIKLADNHFGKKK